jgi:hypothetical protein
VKKYMAPMSKMQKREWDKSISQVFERSKKDPEMSSGPKSVVVPPKGKAMNPRAVKDYDEVITRKLNKDDTPKKR